MSTLTSKKMRLVHTDSKRKAADSECADGGDVKHAADTMVLLLNDGTDGANLISTYYIKIVVGPGVTKSVYEFFEKLLAEKKQYFESATLESFIGRGNDECSIEVANELAFFFKTQIIPANRLSIDHLTLPDMSLIKFVANYHSA